MLAPTLVCPGSACWPWSAVFVNLPGNPPRALAAHIKAALDLATTPALDFAVAGGGDSRTTVRFMCEADFAAATRAATVTILGASITIEQMSQPRRQEQAFRIFIGGDRSQVGKSSCCLGLLAALCRRYGANQVAYIKPATQCETPQLVTKYCASNGIACVGIGPIVYYSGFTRAFIAGETPNSADMLAEVRAACDRLGAGRTWLVIDGVGYPAVGSITGTCNGAIARETKAAVLLIGKKGVGDAIDSYNLNRAYFQTEGAVVVGSVFNRLPVEGYYSLENCKTALETWFARSRPATEQCFGMLPELPLLDGASAAPIMPSSVLAAGDTPAEMKARASAEQQRALLTTEDEEKVKLLAETFEQHVTVDELLAAVQNSSYRRSSGLSSSIHMGKTDAFACAKRASPAAESAEMPKLKRSRAEIAEAASKSGAPGG